MMKQSEFSREIRKLGLQREISGLVTIDNSSLRKTRGLVGQKYFAERTERIGKLALAVRIAMEGHGGLEVHDKVGLLSVTADLGTWEVVLGALRELEKTSSIETELHFDEDVNLIS